MSKRKRTINYFQAYRVPVRIEALGAREFKRILALETSGLLMIGEQITVFMGPERLDLLAMDGHARLWLFEFKREIARPPAVGQLLTYGSYVSGLDYAELNDAFMASTQGKKQKVTLAEAFNKFFGIPIPPVPHEVCLILAAFDFSVTCARLLSFLKYSTGLTIGRLQMQWVVKPYGRDVMRYEYLQLPKRIVGSKGDANAHEAKKYLMLSLEIESPFWEWFRKSDVLLLPDLDDLCDTGDVSPFDENSMEQPFGELPKSLDFQALTPGTGLFVYAHTCKCWHGLRRQHKPQEYPDEEFLANNDPREEYYLSGLLGFGIVQTAPRQINQEDWGVFCRKLNWPEAGFRQLFAAAPWVVDIEWIKTFTPDNSPAVQGIASETCLREIETQSQVKACLDLIGAGEFLDTWVSKEPASP